MDIVYPCLECKKPVTARQHALLCDGCNKWQHRTCNSGVSRQMYVRAVEQGGNLEWMCEACKREKSSNISSFAHPKGESTRLSAVNLSVTNVATAEEHHATDPQYDTGSSFTVDAAIVRRDVIQESSLADPDVNWQPGVVVSEDTEVTEFSIISGGSKRGKDLLLEELGYTYNIIRRRKDVVYWECTKRSKENRCPATVSQRNDIFRRGPNLHSHPPITGIKEGLTIRKVVRDKAREDVFQPAAVIAENAVVAAGYDSRPMEERPCLHNLVRNANRLRQNIRPEDPKDLTFTLQLEHVPQIFFREDVSVGERRHLFFASDEQLTLLISARQWFVDATFYVVSPPFTQLFSIHGFVKKDGEIKQVPLVYALMSGKKRKDYKKVLNAIVLLMTQVNVSVIIADYEAAVWKAAREVLPDVAIRGCYFHYAQAVWRKIQITGLQPAYKSDVGSHMLMKKILALPLLPAEHMIAAFDKLTAKIGDDKTLLKEFVNYVRQTWLTNPVWSTVDLSVYKSTVRTNNDVEGYHRRLNTRARRGRLPLYLLVKLLHEETKFLTIQVRLLSEGKLKRYTRKRYSHVNDKLTELWEKYENKEISTSRLLRQCSRLTLPFGEGQNVE